MTCKACSFPKAELEAELLYTLLKDEANPLEALQELQKNLKLCVRARAKFWERIDSMRNSYLIRSKNHCGDYLYLGRDMFTHNINAALVYLTFNGAVRKHSTMENSSLWKIVSLEEAFANQKQLSPGNYVVCGLNHEGKTMYYSGRAGEQFLTADIHQAFTYTQEGAERKANSFNEMNCGYMRWAAEMHLDYAVKNV